MQIYDAYWINADSSYEQWNLSKGEPWILYTFQKHLHKPSTNLCRVWRILHNSTQVTGDLPWWPCGPRRCFWLMAVSHHCLCSNSSRGAWKKVASDLGLGRYACFLHQFQLASHDLGRKSDENRNSNFKFKAPSLVFCLPQRPLGSAHAGIWNQLDRISVQLYWSLPLLSANHWCTTNTVRPVYVNTPEMRTLFPSPHFSNTF